MKHNSPIPGIAGRAAAWVYSQCIDYRNRRFDAGKGVVEFDRPVISVGNLSTGGTGKTPLVKWIIEKLIAMGHDPCIAMRGYKSHGGESDEAREYEEAFATVPRVVQADRTRGLIELFSTERGAKVDSVVLDDGFQHRQIARQCDVVMVDVTRSPFEDRLLPAGHLRERVESLKRADVCVLSRCDMVSSAKVEKIAGEVQALFDGSLVRSVHRWNSVQVIENGEVRKAELSELKGKRLFACCAIGNPIAFLEQVKAAGVSAVGSSVLGDHDPFEQRTVRDIVRQSRETDGLILTEKDWVKVRRHVELLKGVRVWCPQVAIEMMDGEPRLLEAIGLAFDRVSIPKS